MSLLIRSFFRNLLKRSWGKFIGASLYKGFRGSMVTASQKVHLPFDRLTKDSRALHLELYTLPSDLWLFTRPSILFIAHFPHIVQ
jgi:hypothetical protein